MTNSPLYIAFLWHMHQPFYKEPLTGLYRLPWVRLHGTKDYLDMAEIQSGFPGIRQTYNFTPSLLEQILDYTDNNARDRYLELSLKKASDLSEEDKVFLLENFFLANWETMIRPSFDFRLLGRLSDIRVPRRRACDPSWAGVSRYDQLPHL